MDFVIAFVMGCAISLVIAVEILMTLVASVSHSIINDAMVYRRMRHDPDPLGLA